MKQLSLLLLGSIILPVVLFVGFFRLLPNQESSQPPVVISVQQELDPLKTSLAQQEVEHQAQLDALKQSLQTRQNSYQTKTSELNNQIDVAQNELNDLLRDQEELQKKLNQLQTSRIEQLAGHQAQLKEAQNHYDQQLPELQGQLKETEIELDRVNLQLQGQ